MVAYKEKQYLIFDFENGSTVKYDLSTNQMIGKRGRLVQGLCSQLSKYTIDDVIASFQDDKYRQFLHYVYQKSKRKNYYSNVGTLLSKIKYYARYEQFFSAGITNIGSIKYKITEIPRGIIDLCQQNGFTLTDAAIEQYERYPDIIRNVFNMEFNAITKDALHYNLLQHHYAYDSFHMLISRYKYSYDSLLKYADNLLAYEALDNLSSILRELNDYANMMSVISGKFEKYPKNFLTTHKIACRNYNRLKEQFSEELFSKRRNEKLACSIDDYVIIYPESTQDIKDEAAQQQNCLASYIQGVIDGERHILFMRKKEFPDDSLVTLEVMSGKVVQAKGKFNRELSTAEEQIVQKYNERLERLKHVS